MADSKRLGLYYFAASQAGGAHTQTPRRAGFALDAAFDRAQVQVPAALAHVVRVANLVSKLRLAAANVTNSWHDGKLQKWSGSSAETVILPSAAAFPKP